MESCCNQKSVKQIKIYFLFEILQSSHPFAFMTTLQTLGILSTRFTWNAFLTVLKEFPHMLSTYLLLFLHFAVQPIPNHLNWVEGRVIVETRSSGPGSWHWI
jgi:hypothetical protein